MEQLGAFIVLVGTLAALRAIQQRRAAGRRAALGRDDRTDVPCRLRGSNPPYPSKSRAGRAVWDAGVLRWYPRGAGPAVALDGLTVIRSDLVGAGRVGGPDKVVVHASTASGQAVDVVVHHAFHSILLELLGRASKSDPGVIGGDEEDGARAASIVRKTVPLWAAVLAGLGAAWLGFWLWAFLGGTVVSAEVLTSADELCTVRWSTSTGPESAEVDCDYSTRPGDILEVLAMPQPFRGEAVTPGITQVIVGVVAFALVAPAGITAILRTRRLRNPAALLPPPESGTTAIPVLEPSDLSFDTAAHTMELRSQAEGWSSFVPSPQLRNSPVPRVWWRVPPLRRTAMSAFATASIPLVFTLPAVLFGAGWWITSVSMSFGEIGRTDATVVEVRSGEYPFEPDDVRVRFRVGNRRVDASVAARRTLAAGQTEAILYDAEHAQRARLASGDGSRGGAIVTALLAALTAGLAWSRVLRVRGALREVVDAARQDGIEMRYVLFVDAAGAINAILFNDRGPRQDIFGVPLATDVRGSVPVSGRALVHGDVPEEMGTLVPEVNGSVLWPAGFAVKTTAEEVTQLLNARFFDEEPV